MKLHPLRVLAGISGSMVGRVFLAWFAVTLAAVLPSLIGHGWRAMAWLGSEVWVAPILIVPLAPNGWYAIVALPLMLALVLCFFVYRS
jgi:hypothetical protein